VRTGAKVGFITVAVLSLALCIGANLVVFTVVKALWLRPGAEADLSRVVFVSGGLAPSGDVEGFFFAEGGLDRVRSRSVFEVVAGQVATSGFNTLWRPRVTLHATGHEVEAIGVTWQYFSVMGLERSIKGRDFTRDDDRPGMPVVGIISDRMWRTVFHASSGVIDATVGASPLPLRIVGIAPPGFHGARLGEDVDLWLPRFVVAQVSRVGSMDARIAQPPLLALARLRQGMPLVEAVRAVNAAADPSAPSFSQWSVVEPVRNVYGTPGERTTVVNQPTMLWIAAVTAGVVLVAGCVTLMATIVVYYERRRQELAIRMALGCSRPRLIRSLVLELGALGVAGAAGSCAVAAAGLRVLPSIRLPVDIDLGRFDLSPDWRIVLAGAVISIGTLALSAYAPIRRATHHNLMTELVASSSKATSTSLSLRRGIVALQVAVTVVALVGAGPFVRTILEGLSRSPSFDIDHTMFIRAHTGSGFESERERTMRQNAEPAALRRLVDDVSALPGVRQIALGGSPLGPDQAGSVSLRLFVSGTRAWQIPAALMDVSPTYFSALSMTMVRGRPLSDRDALVAGPERPVVLTESLANALWPGRSPVDQVFGDPRAPRAYRVVGIVRDIAFGSLRLDERRGLFRAIDVTDAGQPGMTRSIDVVLTLDDPGPVIESVRRSVARAFPAAFDTDVATGRDILARDYGREQLGAWFFAGFGLIALVLGVVGVFGLVACVTEARRREMGIRLALGSRPGQLLRLIVSSGVAPVVAGAAAGIGVSVALGRVISTSLLGASELRPSTYAGVAIVVIASAAAAAIAAAWRVRNVSPSEVLRAE
jgi:predicted permease